MLDIAYMLTRQPLISRIESGEVRDARMSTARKLAAALGVSVSELMGEAHAERPPRRSPEELARELLHELEAQTPILVPETTQRASARSGVGPCDAEVWPYMPEQGERRHNFEVVPVKGDCVELVAREGHRAVVNRDASPQPGDIVVAIHDGEALVKYLQLEGDKLILRAIGACAPIEVTKDTVIVGVVRQVSYRPK